MLNRKKIVMRPFDMRKRKSQKRIEEEVENELRKEIGKIFEKKRKKLGVEARLDLEFISEASIVGENVYGEAFPFETPPRIRLEVFALDATTAEITENICHELVHILHPEFREEDKEFKRRIRECTKN